MDPSKEKFNGIEKRRYPRIRASIVDFYPLGKEASKETSFTENIGAGGIRIFTSEDLKVDTSLFLKIYLPFNKDPVEAKGKVVWTSQSSFLKKAGKKNYDVGIEFVEIDEGARQRILDYTQRHY